jgi:ketosteroid isomerase-like protein
VTEPARTPEDLPRLFVERANAGDLEGLVALYEPEAVLRFPAGNLARGQAAIRAVYAELLASRPHFQPGRIQETLRSGDLALTSTVIATGTTAEIARRQEDGSWRWVVDNPAIA